MIPLKLYRYIECAKNTTGTSIRSLNDDCLIKICSYLNIPDLVNFARVCDRFRNAYKRSCMIKFETCDLHHVSKMKVPDYIYFFETAGPHIRHIIRYTPLPMIDIVLDLIATFCKQLKSLTLRNCNLYDELIRKLPRLKRLEKLVLCANRCITGRHLYGLTYLNELNLCSCTDIRTEHLVEAFKTFCNLKKLDVRDCLLDATAYISLIRYCQQLEVLRISVPNYWNDCITYLPLKELVLLDHLPNSPTGYLIEQLARRNIDLLEILEIHSKNTIANEHVGMIKRFRNLKALAITTNEVIDDRALLEFGELTQLEKLNIRGCTNVTNNGILTLLGYCPQLHSINLQFCELITNQLVIAVISFLNIEIQNQNIQRPKPLELLVKSTLINKQKLSQSPEYVEAVAQSLIKVVFHNSPFNLIDGAGIFQDMGPFRHSSDEDADYDDENANPT